MPGCPLRSIRKITSPQKSRLDLSRHLRDISATLDSYQQMLRTTMLNVGVRLSTTAARRGLAAGARYNHRIMML